jgi:hypothetical protein
VVPGGFRLIGKAGTWSLDELATWGLVRADLAITERLATAAAQAPLDAAGARQILTQTGAVGRVSNWWLNHRGLIVLFRGQAIKTESILSPLARGPEGVAASEALVARMRGFGITDREMAGFTARRHTDPVQRFLLPPGASELAGLSLGSVGTPTTRLPGIAANFGEQGWQGLALESEYVILNSVPSGSVLRTIPALEVSPLTISDHGLLLPGTRVP